MGEIINLLKALFLCAAGAFFGFLAVMAGNNGELLYTALALFFAAGLVAFAASFDDDDVVGLRVVLVLPWRNMSMAYKPAACKKVRIRSSSCDESSGSLASESSSWHINCLLFGGNT